MQLRAVQFVPEKMTKRNLFAEMTEGFDALPTRLNHGSPKFCYFTNGHHVQTATCQSQCFNNKVKNNTAPWEGL
jgi:hypothetical protein